MKEKWLRVCPNCGWLVKASAYMPSVETMSRSFRRSIEGLSGADAISGIITCPKCFYYGVPLEVKGSEYGKIKFENRKIDPTDVNDAGHLRIRQEFAVGIIFLLASLAILATGQYITCTLAFAIGLGLVLYGIFKK